MDKFTSEEDTSGNQKMEPLLRAAMDATPGELALSPHLSVGISEDSGMWEVIVLYSGTPELLQEEFPDFAFTFLSGNYAILRLKKEQIASLAASPLIIYIEKPKRLFFEISSAKSASCLSPLQSGSSSGGLPQLSGRGTIAAIIDSGIDYTHPDFRNADGTTRIRALWDQTIAPDPARNFFPPTGYALGTLFSKETINEALLAPTAAERESICPSRDTSGHGTHVAGIAAGNGRASDGVYRGVAYEAELVIVKLGTPDPSGFPSTTQLLQAVDFCVKESIRLRQPMAINLSFGNTYGSHSGSSLLETYLNLAATLGSISIIVGSGNEGNSAGHTAVRIGANESRRIEFTVGSYENSLSIQLWKNYWDEIRLSLQPPAGAAFAIPHAPGSWRFQAGTTQILVYCGEPSPYSLYQEIYMELLAPSYIADGIWTLQLTAQSVSDGSCDLWMPVSAVRGTVTQFLNPKPDTTLTIPSTAAGVISVGAYDSFSNTLAPFSGRGFTWNTNQVKPELTAPGVDITSCAPGGYETRSGTSMAAPFVTGSCLLLMQWGIVMGNDPFLYGEKMKAYLIRGARRLPFASVYPNPETGYGALCVRDSLPE